MITNKSFSCVSLLFLLLLCTVPCLAQHGWLSNTRQLPVREELQTCTPSLLDLADEYMRLNNWEEDTTYIYVFIDSVPDYNDGIVLKVQIAADIDPFLPLVRSGDDFHYDMDYFDSYIDLGNRLIFIHYNDEATKPLSAKLLHNVENKDAKKIYRQMFNRFNGVRQGFLYGKHYYFWLREDGSVGRIERFLVD